MINMHAHPPDPFTPHSTVSAADLKAYAEGRTPAAEAHRIEQHLEADPLLREALEGLQVPGAMAGLARLPANTAERSGKRTTGPVLVLALLAGISAVIVHRVTRTDLPAAVQEEPTTRIADAMAKVEPGSAEIAAAVEQPESLLIGHAPAEPHRRPIHPGTAVPSLEHVERVRIEPATPREIGTAVNRRDPTMRPEGARRPSVQLIYLHDLKLVHPQELHGSNPRIEASGANVDARFADRREEQRAEGEERRVAYLDFMDEALARFTANDHKGCLEELRFVLAQYPEDVNALFYAGLCTYNLGLYDRAEHFLRLAMVHPLQVFHEEGEWYHALALDRSGRSEEARISFERIANAGGFYAQRASAQATAH